MLRMKNNNHKRSSRKKHSNQVDKNVDSKSNYEEDFNEVILNDLVPDDKKEEFGLEEAKPRAKKNSPFNLGLGGKKKPVKKSKSKKEDDPTEVSESTKGSKNKKSSLKKKTNSKQNDSKENHSKKAHSKNTKKTHPKNESIDNEVDNIVENKVENKVDNTETENKNTKNHKKSHSNNHSHKRRIKKSDKFDKEDSLEVKQNVIEESEEILEDIEDQNDLGSFRGVENDNLNKAQEIEVVEEIKTDDRRVENIVWSKENFPKK